MDARTYFEREARQIIKERRKLYEVSYKQLAKNLEEYGVFMEPQVLINRINKGKFSFTFALQVLAAIGVHSIKIPDYPPTTEDLSYVLD